MLSRRFRILAACGLLFGALIAGCTSPSTPEQSTEPDDGRTTLRIQNTRNETVSLRVEIADTADEREIGLSGRASLGPDQGMLFVYGERPNGFWMKDTRIPLSAAFINTCGEIVAIVDMTPLSLEIHNPATPYHFGIEVNQGWFTQNAIRPGNRIEVPAPYRDAGCP